MNGETASDVPVARPPAAGGTAGEPAPWTARQADVPPVVAVARGRRLHRLSAAVVVLGLGITAALTVTSQIGYEHNEQRLTTLQSKLTASLLKTAPVQIQAELGRVVGVAAASSDPVAAFESAMTRSMAPKGPYSSASLFVVGGGSPQLLDHLGSPFLRSPTGPRGVVELDRAASTSSVVTTRVVAGGRQKISYLLSARGPAGTYVLGVSQELAVGRRVTVAAGSPDADLDFALYWGRSTRQDALVETNVAHLPLAGTVSTSVVPFATSSLTLVVSPRGPLSGRWAELTPWGILVAGLVLTALSGVMTERLDRRRAYAEALAVQNRRLYGEQRNVSLTLQRALLPKTMPDIAGVDLAARYIPSVRGTEVGGDWYSVVEVDARRFAFVVGDVSGHGVDAASVMGGLRYTVRTLAKLGYSPTDILAGANGEIDVTTDQHFATVLVGVVDLARSTVTLASAGHPPPLLLHGPDAAYLPVPVGLPLGVADAPYVPLTVGFPTGSTLVAFTDGLVEERTEDLDVGLGRLADVARGAAATTAGALLDTIVAALATKQNLDDIAVVAIGR